jgi:hypothetical protein
MLPPMKKRLLHLTVLATVTLALNSCGIPGALARTAGNTVRSAGGLVNAF